MQMGTRASVQPAPAAVPRSAMPTETPTLAPPLAAAPHPESPLNPLQSAPSASADATLHCLGEPRRRLRGPKRSGAGLEAPRRPATRGSNLAVGGGQLTSHTWHVVCCMLRVACYRSMAPHLVHSTGALPRAHHALTGATRPLPRDMHASKRAGTATGDPFDLKHNRQR